MLPPAVDGDLCLADVPLLRVKHSRTCCRGALYSGILRDRRHYSRASQSAPTYHSKSTEPLATDLLRDSLPWFAVGLAVVVLCQTSFFIRGVRLNVDNITGLSAPDPIPAAGFLIFNVYFLAAVATLFFQIMRDLRMLAGSQRSEMAFVMIGAVVTLVSAVPLQLLLKLFVDTSKLLWLGCPFRVVLFMSDHRVRDFDAKDHGRRSFPAAGDVLRSSHGLLTCALRSGLVAGGFGNSLLFSIRPITPSHISPQHWSVTFAMAPARGFSQSLADRLFVGGRGSIFALRLARRPPSWNQSLLCPIFCGDSRLRLAKLLAPTV